MAKELNTNLNFTIDTPNLDNLIKALECDDWHCQECPFGYNYLDDHGDNLIYACDEQKLIGDAVFYLKMYQYLIKENKDGTM